MTVPLILIATALAIAGVGAYLWHRRRIPEPLRGDWWSEFEREFRTYARTEAQRGHGARRRPSPRRPDRRKAP